jgi:glycosyltransferase involved in cell wall biosynthesis
MSKRDITIYSPASAALVRRSIRRVGGAERQMVLLARELARRGVDIALVVYPVPDPVRDIPSNLRLVERPPHSGERGIVSALMESFRVVRALLAANGRVVVVRTGTPVVGFVACFCIVGRRRFVFSSANNFDFLPRQGASRMQAWLYRFGVRHADAVVVQSLEQLELARRRFPEIRRLVRIASFADEPAEPGNGQEPSAFIWIGRLIDYKRPLLYAELATAMPEARFILIPLVPTPPSREEEDLLSQLKAFAAQSPNFQVGTPLPHLQLMEVLAGSVAVVNTSSFEGMPNTYLEAWCQGVPVLAFEFDPDGVIAGKGLGIAAGGSQEAFVSGARDLWARRFDREACAARARAHVLDVHSTTVVGEQWHELLESLGAFRDRWRTS